MLPTKTPQSNMVYQGPTADIRDLHCERIQSGLISSDWVLTDEERMMVAAGGVVQLRIYSEPIPPVSLSVSLPFCIVHDAQMYWVDGEPKERFGHEVKPFKCPDCESGIAA